MWIMFSDAFISIVNKGCKKGELLVRARRPGDIEKVFGNKTKVIRSTDSDYLLRAVVTIKEVETAMKRAVNDVTYENFKNSVKNHDLHMAYLETWHAMAKLQTPRPYSTAHNKEVS